MYIASINSRVRSSALRLDLRAYIFRFNARLTAHHQGHKCEHVTNIGVVSLCLRLWKAKSYMHTEPEESIASSMLLPLFYERPSHRDTYS